MDKLEKALEKAKNERRSKEGRSFCSTPFTDATTQPATAAAVVLAQDVLEDNKIFAHKTQCPSADKIRLLRTQVLQTMAKNGFKTLAITSPNYGDGKTTVTLNLALSIAQDVKQTVLLVDLDLRKPSTHAYLGLDVTRGLTDFLAGRADLSECLLRLPYQRMSLLPSGERLANSSEIIGSPQMARLAQEIRDRYADRIVLYDMPPLLAQDDPLAFVPHVDAVLLVVKDGVTRAADVERSLHILESFPVIGTVLNDKHEWIWPHYTKENLSFSKLFPFLKKRGRT